MNDEKNAVQTETQFRKKIFFVGNLRVLCFCAMLAAMSVVLAYLAKLIFGTGPYRVTFENLPVIFAGLSFGPLWGGLVAIVSDLSSCLIAGQAINPLITVAAACIGILSGFGRYVFRSRGYFRILCVELTAQTVGSVILKSVALHTFGFSYLALLPRLPIYIGISLIESYFLYLLFKNRQIRLLTERMCNRK